MKKDKDNENKNEKETKDINENENNKNNINNKDNNDENINDLIPKILTKFNIENQLEISYKKLISFNNLYFSLRYYKDTSLNPYDYEIFFSITLEDKAPYTVLNVKCLSNFCLPSFFDNRNLCEIILNIKAKNDGKNKKLKIENKSNDENINTINNNENKIITNSENINSLENIINSIPYFLKEIKNNEEMKHLLKFKETQYTIDQIYDINDFLINWHNLLFRVKQIIDEDTELDRYIIITDIYFLLIEPLEEFKNKGKLLFFGYLHKVIKEENDNPEIIALKWTKNHNKENIQIQLKIEKKEGNLIDIIEKKVRLLTKKYKNVKTKK